MGEFVLKMSDILFSFAQLKVLGIENAFMFLIFLFISTFLVHLLMQKIIIYFTTRKYYLLMTYLLISLFFVCIGMTYAFIYSDLLAVKLSLQINLIYGLILAALVLVHIIFNRYSVKKR